MPTAAMQAKCLVAIAFVGFVPLPSAIDFKADINVVHLNGI
jgi:hypothetical protein